MYENIYKIHMLGINRISIFRTNFFSSALFSTHPLGWVASTLVDLVNMRHLNHANVFLVVDLIIIGRCHDVLSVDCRDRVRSTGS